MSITITPKLIGIWYVPLTEDSDYMAALEELPEGGIGIKYRFRYYKEGNEHHAFDSGDKKNWYSGKSETSSKESAIESIRKVVAVMALVSGQTAGEVLMRNGNVEEFFAELRRQPWAHMKTMPLH